jgi:hypothetical protein
MKTIHRRMRMRITRKIQFVIGALLLCAFGWHRLGNLNAAPAFASLSVSQTVGSHTFTAKTQYVRIVSDGSSTCYFNLFTNVDTAANATTASAALKSGETIGFSLKRSTTDASVDSEGTGSWYRSISYICAGGQTATWRVYSK